MDKDNNNDTSYFNSPDNNNSAGDNHIVYKNKFQPNSRYFTIVIYGLLFVLGAILIFKQTIQYASGFAPQGRHMR